MWVRFSRETVDKFQEKLIDKTGGAHGVLNSGMIDSALVSPEASFGSYYLYDTDLMKCCKLFHALVSNHGYRDGNKRIGLFMFLVSLDTCGIPYYRISKLLLEKLILDIAAGSVSFDQLYMIINNYLQIDK